MGDFLFVIGVAVLSIMLIFFLPLPWAFLVLPGSMVVNGLYFMSDHFKRLDDD